MRKVRSEAGLDDVGHRIGSLVLGTLTGMVHTLRQAGFHKGTPITDVAVATGLSVAQVQAQAGLEKTATLLDDASLDRRFTFPDQFTRGARGECVQDLEGLPRDTVRADGCGTHSTGAGGLLRAKLHSQVKTSPRPPAVVTALPLDAGAFEHEGKWRQALRRALQSAGVDTIPRVLELADRLGLTGHVPDKDEVDHALFTLLAELMRRHPRETVVEALQAATQQPITGIVLETTLQVDTSALPADPSSFPHDGAFRRALREALMSAGLVTTDRVHALAERLELPVPDDIDTPVDALYATLAALHKRHDGDSLRMRAALQHALSAPLRAPPQ